MFFKSCAVLALATGFAAAKPIIAPHAPEQLPAYRRSAPVTPAKRGLFDGFNFINSVNDFGNQEQFFQFQQEEVFFAQQSNNNRFGQDQQQIIIAQAQQVIQIEQQNNGGNRFFNDLSRKAAFRNEFPDVSTVVMVVKQIDVAIDDGQGNFISQSVFAQSAVVANRNRGETQVLMVFESTAVVAQSVFDQFGGFQGVGGFAAPTGVAGVAPFGTGASSPSQTADVQFFGEKPTWSQIVNDPAATAAAAWQAELEDLNNVDNAQLNNDQNQQLAAEEQKLLEEQAQQGEQNQDGEQNQEGEKL